jgi:hypothetical protein
LPIFGEKNGVFSKTNVMIKILHILALFRVKNSNFFAIFFGENILKTITLFPGRTLPVPETEFSFKSRALEREKNAPRTELIF